MLRVYFAITIFLFVLACSDPGSGELGTPEPVQMVQKMVGSDTLEFERGIDAVADAQNKIQVMWHRHNDPTNLQSFYIYRSEEEDGTRRYFKIGEVVQENTQDQDTIYIDSNLDLDQRYSYYVTAVNLEGTESEPSDTVWYKLMEKAQLNLPQDSEVIRAVPLKFGWVFSGIEPDIYILRVEKYFDESFHPLVCLKEVQSNYEGSIELEIDEDWIRDASSFEVFRWRVDCIGDDEVHIGSETSWRLFTISLN